MRILKKLLLNVKTEKRKDNRKKYNETCHVCVGGEGRKINIKDVYFFSNEKDLTSFIHHKK